MSKIRTHLLATAAIVALSSAAYAADMGMPLKAPPPAPPPIQDWSGVWVGLEGGYGWGKQSFNPAFDPFFSTDPPGFCDYIGGCIDPTIGSVNQSGGVFGATAGVQKQWGSGVLGLTASIDWADITGSTTATNFQTTCASQKCDEFENLNQSQSINSKIDEVGYVGPLVGWAFSPNWMVYATGGVAWAHKEDDGSQTQTKQRCWDSTSDCEVLDRFSFSQTESGGLSMFGYAVGGGLNYKYQLDPGSALVFGVKYLHYGFGNNTLTLADNTFGSGFSLGTNTKESIDVVTGSISYFFSIH